MWFFKKAAVSPIIMKAPGQGPHLNVMEVMDSLSPEKTIRAYKIEHTTSGRIYGVQMRLCPPVLGRCHLHLGITFDTQYVLK